MQTQVKKWGNSLALRIPKAYAEQMAFVPDSPVEISIIDGKLVVNPLYDQEISLDDLLSSITEDNLHHEIDTGTAVGNEVW
ncbi:MAG: AbrB/MazE/SpoVT family DNA-binding domain-containing protein [Chloroflexi bacterium]|nr:AbrB/MazE/SpoVT family DNA-binding domain-containing protein [Chloroflexota bacterium]